jgi:hypothetical protein
MDAIHFVERDSDSQAWVIAGNPDEPITQGFKNVIIDETYYNYFVNAFFPRKFYTTDYKFPEFDRFKENYPEYDEKLARTLFDKKLKTIAIELECESMVALAPKMYCLYGVMQKDGIKGNGKPKVKGVVMKQNNLKFDDYVEIYNARSVKPGTNTNIQMHKGIMSKITMRKNMLTDISTKYKVNIDWSTCMPLFANIPAVFYVESLEEDNQQEEYPDIEFDDTLPS